MAGRAAPTDLALGVTGFLTSYLVAERGCSPATVASYARTVRSFLLHVESATGTAIERMSLSAFTTDAVTSFLDAVEASGCSASTRNQRLAALKSLARYAMREFPQFMLEGQRICSIRAKRVRKGEADYLEADAMRALLDAPDRTTPAGRREAALLSALYDTAARVQELIDLELRDLRLSDPRSATLTGKGRKTRVVPLTARTSDLLLAHLADRGIDPRDQPHLAARAFCPPGRSQYTRPGIAKMIARNLERARASNPGARFPESTHPHAFRASKAIHLLDAGVNLIAVRDLLGHASVSTTQVYLRVTTEQKRRAIEEAYPSLSPAPVPNWKEDGDLMAFLREMCVH